MVVVLPSPRSLLLPPDNSAERKERFRVSTVGRIWLCVMVQRW